jgi:hypothetical protein
MVAVPRNSLTLLEAVRKTCESLNLGPQHSGMVRAAEVLAFTIDKMDQDERVRLLGQTIPPLVRLLEQLAAVAGPLPTDVRGLTDEALVAFLDDMGAAGGPD